MSTAPSSEPRLMPAAKAQRGEALQLLTRRDADWLSAPQLLQSIESGTIAADGLWVAIRENRLVGVALGQVAAGRVAVIWPVQLVQDEPESTSQLLLNQLMAWIKGHDVSLIQAVLPPADILSQQRFEHCDFALLADLVYLVSPAIHFPDREPRTAIDWLATDALDRGDLEHLVLATYDGTLDCPALNNVCDVRDVLAGYECTGASGRSFWRVAKLGQRIIGCLLLADHPANDHVELVYMGLVPRYRGRHRGRWVVQQAQWMTRNAGRSNLVLAVDSRNIPARKIYESMQFSEWGRRRVLYRREA